ncbi:MAG: hypothetical protein O7D29_03715, partial [Gemmatimonadetes bacterium]|nr:hypothetical protein [Gemmatimonadota bacterium]
VHLDLNANANGRSEIFSAATSRISTCLILAWAPPAFCTAKIKEVEILDAAAEKISERPLAFAFNSKWTAMGTVGHWGHVHTRKNLYDAIVTVEAVEGNWKITNLELLEEKRVDPYTQTAKK